QTDRRAGSGSRHRLSAFRAVSVEDGARQCALRLGAHGAPARGTPAAGANLPPPRRGPPPPGQPFFAAFPRPSPPPPPFPPPPPPPPKPAARPPAPPPRRADPRPP